MRILPRLDNELNKQACNIEKEREKEEQLNVEGAASELTVNKLKAGNKNFLLEEGRLGQTEWDKGANDIKMSFENWLVMYMEIARKQSD